MATFVLMTSVLEWLQWTFIGYFVCLNSVYLALIAVSTVAIVSYMQRQDLDHMPQTFLGMEPPISILAPAYNEEPTVVEALRSLLQLTYNEYEIILINDGSTDRTLEVVTEVFELVAVPAPTFARLITQPVRAVYSSRLHPNLWVIDKSNGGKADSLNAGVNLARHPLFCAVDADCVLQRDSLQRVVLPFMDDHRTVASGGTVRVANGCEVESGFLVRTGLPKNPLALFQIVEYLRAFLFGRLGWSPLNAMLIVSGAFGVFRRDVVVEVGGYRTDTIGEDMELVVRLHSHMRLKNIPYRITYVPDPVCWTEVPEDLKTLRHQRIRWQRGLGESLSSHLGLLFHRKAGAVGWLAMPFFVVFELFGPMFEAAGYVFMSLGFLIGIVSSKTLALFMFLALGVSMLLSMGALYLEELSFHIYPRYRHLLVLFLVVVCENLGYRQLNCWWRTVGFFTWATGTRGLAVWGEMRRKASWTRAK
jgi:cellulose synthase/poly-beta-1,6-N-acetylglucosamine synthase-like glycosyltransferase